MGLILKLKKIIFSFKSKFLLKALFLKVAPSVEHSTLLNALKIDTLIDVGANRGQFSLIFRYYNPFASIYAFEPLPNALASLKRVFRFDTRIKFFDFAVGDSEKMLPIHVSHRDDSSSLLPISQLQDEIFPGTYQVDEISVVQKRLDVILNPCDLNGFTLLKIDVQGYEMNALLGAIDLFSKIDAIYVELSFVELYEGQSMATEVVCFLSDNKFDLVGVFNVIYRKSLAVQADFLFIQKRRFSN